MSVFDTISGLTKDEWRVILALVVSVGSLTSYLFFVLGKARGWRDVRKAIDRDNIVVESVILVPTKDPKVFGFTIETLNLLPTLHEVFASTQLEGHIKRQVAKTKEGAPLFPAGELRYTAMERACLYITGCDPVATQAAMCGRHNDYHSDSVAMYLTAARGEDGHMMPRLLKAFPHALELVAKKDEYTFIPLRQVHEDYIPLVRQMAVQFASSQKFFAEEKSERIAGQYAAVWTTIVRTHKVFAA